MKKILILFLILIFISGYFFIKKLECKNEVQIENKNINQTDNTPSLPIFHDYEIDSGDRYEGKAAKIDFNSHPDALNFKTALSEGIKQGVNFAFYYTIVSWGCGTQCQSYAIIDNRDGKVYFPGIGSLLGIDFEKDSKLIIINPVKNIYEAHAQGDEPEIYTEYYVWENNELELIKEAKVRYEIKR